MIWYHLSGAMLDAHHILRFVVFKMSDYLEKDLSLNLPKISSIFFTCRNRFSNIVGYFIWMCHLQRSLKGCSLSPWVIQGHKQRPPMTSWKPSFFCHTSFKATKQKGRVPAKVFDFAAWATKFPLYWLLGSIPSPTNPKKQPSGALSHGSHDQGHRNGPTVIEYHVPIKSIYFQKCSLYMFRKTILYTTR